MNAQRKRWLLIAKLMVAVGVIAWLIFSEKIDFRQIGRVGEGWPWLVAALIPYGCVLALCALRWRHLLLAQGIDYEMRDAFALTMVGHFFNQFLLGTTGGDVVKAYAVAMEQPGRRSLAAMSVFVDRVVGLLVLVGVALVAIPLNLERILGHPYLKFLACMVAGVFAASLLGGYVFYSDRVRSLGFVRRLVDRLPLRKVMAKLAGAVYVYKFHQRIVASTIITSILIHCLVVVMHFFLAKALMADSFSWGSLFFLVPIAQIAMAIPINPPGAIGTGEWIYATLLPMAGIPATQGGLICVLQRVVYYAWALVGCAYYVNRRSKVEAAVHAAEVDDEAIEGGGNEITDRPGGVGSSEATADGNRALRTRVDSSAR